MKTPTAEAVSALLELIDVWPLLEGTVEVECLALPGLEPTLLHFQGKRFNHCAILFQSHLNPTRLGWWRRLL